jgi:hypothetical protein
MALGVYGDPMNYLDKEALFDDFTPADIARMVFHSMTTRDLIDSLIEHFEILAKGQPATNYRRDLATASHKADQAKVILRHLYRMKEEIQLIPHVGAYQKAEKRRV